MKLIAYLDQNAVNDNYRYVIKDDSIDITVAPNDNLEQLCKSEDIKESIREYYRERGYFYKEEDILKFMVQNKDILEIESCTNTIHVEDIISFMQNNSLEKFNKITIVLNQNQYCEIDKLINQELPKNTFFKLPDDSLEISYEDYIKTVEAVNSITEEIKELSPLEQIMYLYDEIRDRVYCDDETDKMSARNVSSVLLGDKIVCLGFANIFNIALKKLGINTVKEIIWKNNSRKGHARNIVYINDTKYNLNSLSFFDLTFDSKKCENDDTFLQSYAYFFRPLSFFKDVERKSYYSETISFFDLDSESQLNTIKNMTKLDDIKNQDFLFSMMKLRKLYDKDLEVLTFIDFSTGNINLDKVIQEYNKCINLLEREINPEAFAECFATVRKKQQELNPERFHLSFDDMVTTIHNRFKPKSNEEELLLSIFGQKFFTEEDAKKIAQKILGKNNQSSFQKKKS